MFHENLYPDFQIKLLQEKLKSVLILEGKIIEIGCWEGRSTIELINTAYPQSIDAVDTWEGSIAEGPHNILAVIAKHRNVYSEFQKNVANLTLGNVTTYRMDCFAYLENLKDKIKFCHIDASHDYDSVKKTLEMLRPKLVHGAVLCGDDYRRSGRIDLKGGVPRAVKEACPEHNAIGDFWWWENY